MPEVLCNSVNTSEGGMALSTFVPLSPTVFGGIENLLVENRTTRSSLCVVFAGAQV